MSKKISELADGQSIQAEDLFAIARNGQNYYIKGSALPSGQVRLTAHTVKEAKAGTFEKGEVIEIFDHTVEDGSVCSTFILYSFTKTPAFFKGDVKGLWYEINGSQQLKLLINSDVATAFTRQVDDTTFQNLSALINNSGVIFYNTDKKSLCTIVDGKVQEIALKTDIQSSVLLEDADLTKGNCS